MMFNKTTIVVYVTGIWEMQKDIDSVFAFQTSTFS